MKSFKTKLESHYSIVEADFKTAKKKFSFNEFQKGADVSMSLLDRIQLLADTSTFIKKTNKTYKSMDYDDVLEAENLHSYDEETVYDEVDDLYEPDEPPVVHKSKRAKALKEFQQILMKSLKWKNGKMVLYRCITVHDADKYLAELGKRQSVGVYWTFDKKYAKCYWGNERDTVVLVGLVDPKDVDLETTLVTNTAYSGTEHEIRVKKGAAIELTQVIYKPEGGKPETAKVKHKVVANGLGADLLANLSKYVSDSESQDLSFLAGHTKDFGQSDKLAGQSDLYRVLIINPSQLIAMESGKRLKRNAFESWTASLRHAKDRSQHEEGWDGIVAVVFKKSVPLADRIVYIPSIASQLTTVNPAMIDAEDEVVCQGQSLEKSDVHLIWDGRAWFDSLEHHVAAIKKAGHEYNPARDFNTEVKE